MLPSATPYGIPEGHHMTPGKTYIGILPGHTRPAFIRKRPVDAGRPPLFLTQIFGSSRRAYSVESPRKPSMFCRSRSDVYYDYATARYRPKMYLDQSPGRIITSVQQTCASCGKFRSARWQSRHPLIPGRAITSRLCGRCRDKHTSSEEERPKHRRRRRHHRRRDYTESTDDSWYTSRESRRTTRRHRSYSRGYRRPSSVRSSSREKVRIIIANQNGDRLRRKRELTRSSSMEPIRVIRRTEVVDLPERPPRTRSILRSSSQTEFEDSATHFFEDLDPPRYLPRPRPVSRVSYIEDVETPRYHSRPRSLSHVSYVEESSRYRSRPRSVSRVSHIEHSNAPRSRRRARSSSQVRFVDEIDEAVSPCKPRRLKRRRVVYFDGAADTERSEQQACSHTPSNGSSSQGAVNGDGGTMLIEDIKTPHPRASEKGRAQGRGAELIEEHSVPYRRFGSRTHKSLSPVFRTVSDHSYRQPSKTRSYAYDSDHEAALRPAFRQAQLIQSLDGNEEPPSHHSSYIDFQGLSSDERFPSSVRGSREPSRQRMFTRLSALSRQKRERVRESDESSGSGDGNYPRPLPITYRHVEAPEPPTPRADFLVEMLQNATITPPSAQYARGRSSHRNYYSKSDSPSQSHSGQSFSYKDSEDGHTEYRGQHMTGDTLYGGPSLHESGFESKAKYNWMT